MQRRSRIAAFLAITAGGTACGTSPAGDRVATTTVGPAIHLVDSTLLVDPDSAPLGAETLFIARSRHGDVYVNDMQLRRVVRFDSAGHFAGVIGKRGDGPGEFNLPGVVKLLPGDTTLAVIDVNRRLVSRFDASSGRFLGAVPAPFQDVGATWTVDGGVARFAIANDRALLAEWNLSRDTIVAAGMVPPHLLGQTGVTAGYGRAEIAVDDSLTLALLPTEGGLDVYGPDLRLQGWLPLPSARRMGDADDLIARQKTLSRSDPNQILGSSSDGLHRLGSGEFLAIFVDMRPVNVGPRTMRYDDYRLYATLVSADLQRACVDGAIPVVTDVAPIPIFDGDTVIVLARQVTATTRVRSVVDRFAVSDSGCQWVPTGGIRAVRAADSAGGRG